MFIVDNTSHAQQSVEWNDVKELPNHTFIEWYNPCTPVVVETAAVETIQRCTIDIAFLKKSGHLVAFKHAMFESTPSGRHGAQPMPTLPLDWLLTLFK